MKTILLPALLIMLCAAPVVVGSDANVDIRNGVPADRATLADAKLALRVALAARESIAASGLTVVAL